MFALCSILVRWTGKTATSGSRDAPRAAITRAGSSDICREVVDDGWETDAGDLPVLRTQTSIEVPRSVITYNRSPDLPFDRSINPYRGCEHGCVYCFARPSHAYLGLSPGLDFETRLIARPDAPQVLQRELAAKRYRVAPIAIGTNTDPYQPIEKDHEIMRACLRVLSDAGHPVAIVTKGALIERDIDILGPMARRGLVRVGISVTTLDAKLSRLMEPRAPAPARRLQMIRRLAEAGIPVRIMASPMIPALTDPELEAILKAGRDAGARHASWIMLRLPPRCHRWCRSGWRRIIPTAQGGSWSVCVRCTAARNTTPHGTAGCGARGHMRRWWRNGSIWRSSGWGWGQARRPCAAICFVRRCCRGRRCRCSEGGVKSGLRTK